MKHRIAAFAAAALLATSLASCGTLTTVYDAATGAAVPPAVVIIAGNAFDAVEATATNYLTLKRCTGQNGPICRSPAVTKRIIPAVRAGRVARNNLEQFLQDHPGQLGPKGDYDALVAATTTLKGIIAQYNVGQ